MTLERAQCALEERTGLAFDLAARGRLADGLQAVADSGRDVGVFVARVELGDEAALRELLVAVTLQETRFFRDPAVFDALQHDVLPLLPDPVTVWSAGCALGQEAYSLAMLLEEQGREGFRVLATDLSPAAVKRTTAGIYGERELRGLDPARRRRHLRPLGDGRFEVDPALRARVMVSEHNLASGPLPDAAADCSLVLCRYVLIYLQRPLVSRLLERLHATLPADALLVVGAAESLWHLTERFALEPVGPAFGYRRVDAAAAPARPAPAPAAREAAASPRAGEGRRPAAGSGAAAGSRHRARSAEAGDRATERAAAASGRPDPTLRDLLATGEVAFAAGDHAAAAAAFRRAAYLEPRSPLAHLQLGLALEAAGDPGAQRAYRAAHHALGAADPDHVARDLDGHAVTDLARLLADRLGATAG